MTMVVRIWLGFILLVAWYLVIFSRLFYWQILAGENLRRQAASQYFYELKIPAQRGQILAVDASPLVINQPAFLVYAENQQITDPLAFATAVAPLLGQTVEDLRQEVDIPGRVWMPLAHKVPAQTVDKLRALKLAGLGFEKEPKRYYPEASLSAQLFGFVGSDQNGNPRGYFGLEGFYNRELGGRDGLVRIEKDASGKPILVGEAKRLEGQDGNNLITWIDRSVQYLVEKKLKEGLTKYGAREGSVVVLDPTNGGVIAMAAYPSYDPADFVKFDRNLYKNPVVAGSYEPGSTFKTLLMSAGLEEKLVTPTSEINENGPVAIGEYYIRTWNEKYHGKITMTDVLVHSSNVGMVEVARRLGRDKLLKYLHDFGFGEPTGIDLEEETSPPLRPDKEWLEIDLATASFGQGIAVTPLQMVRAVAVLANGGWLVEPHVVREIRDSRGQTRLLKPKKIRQVISTATAKTITEMMVAAVEQGEAKWAKPRGYQIAGKTGTAQIPVAGHYDEKRTIASFVGFAPADNPRFVMLVTLTEPTSSPWGSETAAPLFFAIARDLLTYYRLPPQ